MYRTVGFVVALACWAAPVVAQDKFPSKQLNLIVPYAPGGGNDITARAIAPALQRAIGQPVVVTNKAGAAGGVASQGLATGAADGYNLLVSNTAAIILPAVDKVFGRAPAFTKDDFTQIAMLSADPVFLFVAGDAPWKTLKDLLADAKAKDGSLVYASGGLYGPTHLPIEMMLKATNLKMRHLPTAGGGPAMTAVLGGNAQLVASFPAVAGPQAKAGKLKPLASWGTKRLPDWPDVPTFKELGIDIEYIPWIGLLAHKNTPEPVVKTLREAVKKAVEEKDYKDAMAKAGSGTNYLDQDEFRAWYNRDAARLEPVIQAVGKVE